MYNKVRMMIASRIPIFKSEDMFELLCERIAKLERSEMELKSAAVVLDENQRLISALMNDLPGMVFRCRNNRARTMEFVSDGCRSLTGLSAVELTDGKGGSYGRLIHRKDRESVVREINSAVALKKPFRLIYRIVAAGGLEKWVWEHGHAVYDLNDKPLVLEGFITDITDYKNAELKLKQKTGELEKAMRGTIQAISRMVEMRDAYTAGHEARVAELATRIATELKLSGREIEGVRTAGLIHDIGKINIPVEILNKPGMLNPLELLFVKEHAQSGYEILRGIEFPWPIADIVRQHHERMDGSGYPRGLRDEEILFAARIIAVADVVEAMASDRPYRPALGLDAAIAEISKHRGRLYEADAVTACLWVLKDQELPFTNGGLAK
jgi:putative nucleotidyltransferase with HDIG domain/PAS domain S-box-containing protein